MSILTNPCNKSPSQCKRLHLARVAVCALLFPIPLPRNTSRMYLWRFFIHLVVTNKHWRRLNAKRYYAPKFCSPAVLLDGLGFRYDCIVQVTRCAEQVERHPVLIVLFNLKQFSSKGFFQLSFFPLFKIMGPTIKCFFDDDRCAVADLCVEKEVDKLGECWCLCIPF